MQWKNEIPLAVVMVTFDVWTASVGAMQQITEALETQCSY